jgi:vesicular inhibitory amino acid transporter
LIDTDVFTLRPSVIADMAGAAYGARGRILISTMFMLELIAASVALIVLFADSLHVLFPDISTITFKVMAFFILTPTTYLAIRHLSYTSFVGILSSFTLVAVIFYDGATKLEHPGSLTDPMPTTLLPIHWMTLPLAFGQVAAGFAGHATFPSVYRDMAEPEDFPRVVNYTYLATSLIYAFMASAGYLMFGKDVSVITENMMHTPGFNLVLNKLAVWLIVINPFTKYALTLSGVNFTIELSIFRHPALGSITKSKLSMRLVQFVTRLLVSSVVVLIAILFPAFDRVIVSTHAKRTCCLSYSSCLIQLYFFPIHLLQSLLGSCFSYSIAAIFPLACHLKMYGGSLSKAEKTLNWVLLIVCAVLASTGTVWSFLPNDVIHKS